MHYCLYKQTNAVDFSFAEPIICQTVNQKMFLKTPNDFPNIILSVNYTKSSVRYKVEFEMSSKTAVGVFNALFAVRYC